MIAGLGFVDLPAVAFILLAMVVLLGLPAARGIEAILPRFPDGFAGAAPMEAAISAKSRATLDS